MALWILLKEFLLVCSSETQRRSSSDADEEDERPDDALVGSCVGPGAAERLLSSSQKHLIQKSPGSNEEPPNTKKTAFSGFVFTRKLNQRITLPLNQQSACI